MTDPLYSIGTWDSEESAYTPQIGVTVPSLNITRSQLRVAIRDLQDMGYSCHRRRDSEGYHDDNDTEVLIERTDGKPEAEILAGWER